MASERATEPHIESDLDAGDASGVRMPAGVRRAVFCILSVMLAFAAYLIAVRGEALLVDIQALGARVWCW
jgi:hypothetical protein